MFIVQKHVAKCTWWICPQYIMRCRCMPNWYPQHRYPCLREYWTILVREDQAKWVRLNIPFSAFLDLVGGWGWCFFFFFFFFFWGGGEFTGHWWFPLTKASDAEFCCFCLICAGITGWVNNGEAGDLRRHGALYDVTVMRGNATNGQSLWWILTSNFFNQ